MILDLPDLQKLSGYKRPADVKRWLRDNGVAFMVQPSGRPVTTLDAINRAMYGTSKYDKPDFSPPPCSRPRSSKIKHGPRMNGSRTRSSNNVKTVGVKCNNGIAHGSKDRS